MLFWFCRTILLIFRNSVCCRNLLMVHILIFLSPLHLGHVTSFDIIFFPLHIGHRVAKVYTTFPEQVGHFSFLEIFPVPLQTGQLTS